MARTADERGDYEVAFNALKAGQYAESAQLFQDFLRAHPSGAYAPNAYYWLGESYYVTQNYTLAQQQFQALIDRYPTPDKAPGALLKVGLSQYGQQLVTEAEKTLRSDEDSSELQSQLRISYYVTSLKKQNQLNKKEHKQRTIPKQNITTNN